MLSNGSVLASERAFVHYHSVALDELSLWTLDELSLNVGRWTSHMTLDKLSLDETSHFTYP